MLGLDFRHALVRITLPSLAWIPSLAVANAAQAQEVADNDSSLNQRVKSAMHLRDFKMLQITARPTAGSGMVNVPLMLDGHPVQLRLAQHSLRAPGFKLYTRDANGQLIEKTPPPPATYRGSIIDQPGSSVSATIINNQWSIQIDDGQTTWWVQPLSDALKGTQIQVDPQQHIVYRHADVETIEGIKCGVNDAADANRLASGAPALGPALPGGCVRQAEIACDSDFEYFTLNGSDVNLTTLDIESIINGMDFIYRRDCGIAYLVTAIIVQDIEPDPYSAASFGALLNEFKNHWNTNQTLIPRDIAHLFTGKDIDPGPGGVIGVAFLPGVCTPNATNPSADGYGLSESRFSPTITYAQRVSLTAHELGHNWNALHCNQGPDPYQPCIPVADCAIMCSSLSGCTQNNSAFEPCTASQIMAYRDSLTCLGLTGSPTWTTGAIIPLEVMAEDRFGTSVCIDGNLAIVGAGSDDVPAGIDGGSAYIFRFNGTNWVQEAIIENPTTWGKPNDRFGTSVAISSTVESGDVAVIGAYLWDFVNPNMTTQRSSGVAYVYRYNGTFWVLEQRLIPIDHNGGDFFGLSVSIDGDLIGVGAQFNDDLGSNSGSAYVFRKVGNEWFEEIKLAPGDGLTGDNFGIHVDVQAGTIDGPGDAIVVGAWADDHDAVIDAGSAYVYRKDSKTGWAIEQKLIANDALEGDRFGTHVGMSGDVVIIGTPFADSLSGTNSGAAYIFRRNIDSTWSQEARLTASDAAMDDLFGFSVAVDADLAIVGAYLKDSAAATNTGAAYLFRNAGTSWTQESILTGPTMMDDQFGYSVSVSNGNTMVGAWLSDNPGPINDGGSVYVGLPGPALDCNLNTVPDSCDIATGTSMDVNTNGIPDECEKINMCPGDVAQPPDGVVDINDLVTVVINWGACPIPCPPVCPGDVNQNCTVNIDDLVALVITWGDCPKPPPPPAP